MIASADKRSLIDRMMGAALLDGVAYQEMALIPSTRVQAAVIVIVSAVAAGLGSLGAGMVGVVAGCLAGLAGWGVFAFVTYWMATTRFGMVRTVANWGATWRVLGIAVSPRVFLVFTLVPDIGFLIGLAVHAWVLITSIFAVKLALDMETRPAIVAVGTGWLPMLLVWALVSALL
jgi:hypothetical protein